MNPTLRLLSKEIISLRIDVEIRMINCLTSLDFRNSEKFVFVEYIGQVKQKLPHFTLVKFDSIFAYIFSQGGFR